MILKKFTLLLFISLSAASSAQDSQYWTNQFGPKSALLSGAVVGDVIDHSAAYYNPAGLAFADSTAGISISSTAYEFQQINYKNGAGKGIDLTSTNTQIVPLIITGKLDLSKYSKLQRLSIGYFLVSKDKSTFKATARTDGFFDVIKSSNSPGNEEYVSQYNLIYSVSETNAGIAVGYKISDVWSVGISNSGSYRANKQDNIQTARLIPNYPNTKFQLASFDEITSVVFSNARTIFKFSTMARLKKLNAGVTITSPSINVWGKSTISENVTVSDIFFDTSNQTISFFGDDRQEIKKTQYKTPLSVAIGLQYDVSSKTGIYLTVEWFNKLKEYTLVQPARKAFFRPEGIFIGENGSSELLKITEARREVVNVALGIEHILNSKITLLAGARTNFNSVINNYENPLIISNSKLDLFHASIGVTYKRSKSTINAGILLGYGKKSNLLQIVNVTDPKVIGETVLQGDRNNSLIASYNSFSFMLGYVYYLK